MASISEKDPRYILSKAYVAQIPADSELRTRFSEITLDNFEAFQNGIFEYKARRNDFLQWLINRIGRTYVNTMFANNPFEFLRGEELPFGDAIEDIWVDLVQARDFDPEGKALLERALPDVKALFYIKNTNLIYKVSISDKEIKKAFTSAGSMSALTQRILNSLYESAKHDRFLFFKQLIAGYSGWNYVTVPKLDGTETAAKNFGKTMSATVDSASFDNRTYNAVGVMNNVPDSEGMLIMTVNAKSDLTYDYLANVFNLDKAELKKRTIIVDNFLDMKNVEAVYVDKRIFQNHYLYEDTEAFRNVDGRFTTYSYVEEAIYAMSKFMTGIAFLNADAATVTVTYNANGGTGTMSGATVPTGSKYSTKFSVFTPPKGKTFSGWSTTAAGTELLAEISDITVNADTTLYAIYK